MNFLDVLAGCGASKCRHHTKRCEESLSVGEFHGGISEQWNYMLAGYRCKAVPRYE
jgi:hypothetical protein